RAAHPPQVHRFPGPAPARSDPRRRPDRRLARRQARDVGGPALVGPSARGAPRAGAAERPADLFAALETAAGTARGHLGTSEGPLEVAGLHLRIRWAGPALRDLMWPALAHSVAEPVGLPDLDVAVWDSARSGVPLPGAAGLPADHTPYGLARVRRRG